MKVAITYREQRELTGEVIIEAESIDAAVSQIKQGHHREALIMSKKVKGNITYEVIEAKRVK